MSVSATMGSGDRMCILLVELEGSANSGLVGPAEGGSRAGLGDGLRRESALGVEFEFVSIPTKRALRGVSPKSAVGV